MWEKGPNNFFSHDNSTNYDPNWLLKEKKSYGPGLGLTGLGSETRETKNGSGSLCYRIKIRLHLYEFGARNEMHL